MAHRRLGKPLKDLLALACFTPSLGSGRDEEIQQPVRQQSGRVPGTRAVQPALLGVLGSQLRQSSVPCLKVRLEYHTLPRVEHMVGRRNGLLSREWTTQTARVTVGSWFLSHCRTLMPPDSRFWVAQAAL